MENPERNIDLNKSLSQFLDGLKVKAPMVGHISGKDAADVIGQIRSYVEKEGLRVKFEFSDAEKHVGYGSLGALIGLGVGAFLTRSPLGMIGSAVVGAAAGVALSTVCITVADGDDGEVTLTTA